MCTQVASAQKAMQPSIELHLPDAELDTIGEPPPLTPICKLQRELPRPPPTLPDPATILFPIARRGFMSVAESSAAADQGVVQSRASAFRAIPVDRPHFLKSASPRFVSGYADTNSTPTSYRRWSRHSGRSAHHPRVRHAQELKMKWAAVRSFLKQAQGETELKRTALEPSFAQTLCCEAKPETTSHSMYCYPRVVSSDVSTNYGYLPSSRFSPPTSPAQERFQDNTSVSSGPTSPSKSSCDETVPSSLFSHMFQPLDYDDGFDANVALQLQNKVCDDPAVRIMPSGEQVFGCRRCQKTFVWRRHLEQHYFSHKTEDKASLCHVCGKNFTRADHLNRHAASAHSQSKFVCQICGDSFLRASHLDRHWRVVHPREAIGAGTQVQLYTAKKNRQEGSPVHPASSFEHPTFSESVSPPSPQSLLTELYSQRKLGLAVSPPRYDSNKVDLGTRSQPRTAFPFNDIESDEMKAEEFESEMPLVIDVNDDMDTNGSD